MTITPDPKNANRGTQRGRGLLEASLREYGAGRSVLADRNGVLIAGNKTHEVATEIGLPVRVIETDGNELVVVQRTDLDLTRDKAAVELGIADNRVGQVSLEWDPEMLAELSAADELDMSKFWNQDEIAALLSTPDPASENEYTTDTPSPIYTPTGEQPDVSTLMDTTRRDALARDIAAANLADDIREFLNAATTRHVVFDYRRIAEFYAHADSDVQRLMEDSALVIIDFNRAIELGYVRLSSRLNDILAEALDDD